MFPGMSAVPLMAPQRTQFVTDFADLPLGSSLTANGWTRGLGTTGGSGSSPSGLTATYTVNTIAGGSISDRGVTVSQPGSGNYEHCRWTALGLVSNFAFLALVKLIDMPDAVGGGGFCWVAGDGASSDGYDFVLDADSVGSGSGNDSVHVSQFTNGFYEDEGAQQKITLNTTDRFWMRGYKNGTTLGIKAWSFAAAEPTSFQTRTDSTHQGSRYFGIQTVMGWDFRIDWLSVIPDGTKTAPGPNG
jgi:hypothetical protein